MMRLPAMLRLPADPNHRLARIKQFRMAGIAGVVAPTVVTTWAMTPGAEAVIAVFGLISLLFGGVVTMEMTRDRTRHVPSIDRPVSRRLFRTLATACEIGMSTSMRRQAEQDIAAWTRILSTATGNQPWIVVERMGDPEYRYSQHMTLRGHDLARVEKIHAMLESPTGCGRHDMLERIAYVVPLVVLVARDFGLDVTGLVPPISRVPGQRLDAPVPVATLAAPVHRLAQEWTAFDRSQVDDVLRNAADTAAGAELDDLERRWLAARADADPADVDALDQTFLRGAAGLSATIADAIAARARSSRDALTTMTRFIETKHAA